MSVSIDYRSEDFIDHGLRLLLTSKRYDYFLFEFL